LIAGDVLLKVSDSCFQASPAGADLQLSEVISSRHSGIIRDGTITMQQALNASKNIIPISKAMFPKLPILLVILSMKTDFHHALFTTKAALYMPTTAAHTLVKFTLKTTSEMYA